MISGIIYFAITDGSCYTEAVCQEEQTPVFRGLFVNSEIIQIETRRLGPVVPRVTSKII
jgi:hypothetical protein